MNSIVTVTEPATVTRLTTPEAFKLTMGIGDSSQDAKIERAIDAVTAKFQTHTNRIFCRQTYSELFRGLCRAETLLLKHFPVAEIASITADGTEIDAADYEIDPETGLLCRLSSDVRCAWSAAKLVVVYDAGYLLPEEEGRTLPFDLEEAALKQLTADWYGSTRDPSVKREDIPGLAEIEYWVGTVGESASICDAAMETLDRYRDVRL